MAGGGHVNLERALKVGDELGGHMVSGHVDGVAEILSRRDFDGMAHFRFRAPKDLAKFIAVKGSVALDGTSLTVNAVEGDTFEVLLIPHTLKVTTWGDRKAGDLVNIEVDQMARYAARLWRRGAGPERLSFDRLPPPSWRPSLLRVPARPDIGALAGARAVPTSSISSDCGSRKRSAVRVQSRPGGASRGWRLYPPLRKKNQIRIEREEEAAREEKRDHGIGSITAAVP